MGTASSNNQKQKPNLTQKRKKTISNNPQNKQNKQEYIKNRFRDEFKFDEKLPILPNYAENFSIDTKKKLKCNIIQQDRNQKTKNLTIIILNDIYIEKSRNYIKEHYRFQKYRNNKNLVDKLILSRKDIDRKKYEQFNHDLEDYNLYAEIVDASNYQILKENEIDNIRKIFENINTDIENEIKQFIDLCFYLIIEYVKFVLVKIAKLNECEECGTKCLYILFCREQKRTVEEYQPTNDDFEMGINTVKNLLNYENLTNSNENSAANVIYLNENINKNDLELIEKNTIGTSLYIKNITQLESLLKEIYQKNNANNLNYKFLLVSSGELYDNLIKFLNTETNNIYKDIIDKVIICSEKKKQYSNEKIVTDVIDNPKSLGETIKKYKINSEFYKTFPIINYELYTKEYNQIHKQIAKYYGKISYNYKDAINLFKEFLFNDFKGPLKIDASNKMYKRELLLKSLEVFSSNDEDIIKKYTEQKNSFYQDFNYWLNSLDKTAISKIAYFVSSLMFALNNRLTGIICKESLFRGMNIDFSNVIKYYMNYIKDNNIISFPSFTSTSINEKTAESFIKKNKNNFGVLFKINYNYDEKIWKFLAINVSSISAYKSENERLFLPFTFYKIKNFELNIENRLAKIELDCIFKKEILEEKLNEKNNVIYNKKDNIMELDNQIIIKEENFLINDNEHKIRSEISLKIKIENDDVNKNIFFLDNTNGKYSENGQEVNHNHDNLKEMDETNTTLIINGKTETFKKSFTPTKSGTYTIILKTSCDLSNCAFMFCRCKNITDIDFSKFKTEKVENMQRMFEGCSNLNSLDFKNFNTEKVTNMEWMFGNCNSLKSLDLGTFNTQNVTIMDYMFCNCDSLTTLNLSSFNTQKVNNMYWMFGNCSKLTSLDLSSFNTSNVTNMGYMLYGCESLTTINLSTFDTKNVTSMESMFDKCSSLTILNISKFNTMNVTNMSGMFCGLSNLLSLNLSSFNTQNVTDMSFMFGENEGGCASLKTLDLSSFNTQNVNNMDSMLYGCFSLTSVNLSSFNTENVTNMSSMFQNCSSLKNVNLSSFNTQQVDSMFKMFYNCSSLMALDLSSFNTKNVSSMAYMFENCSSLTNLNLSSFNADNIDVYKMFEGCKKLSKCDCSDKKIKNEFRN